MSIRHITTHINRPADEVAAFVRDYRQLPRWAAGLAAGVEQRDGRWFTESPMGSVEVRFVDDNPFGVCDHDVTMPDGTVMTNPLRVLADGPDACDVVFSLRRAPGVDAAQFEADAELIAADLERLRALLE